MVVVVVDRSWMRTASRPPKRSWCGLARRIFWAEPSPKREREQALVDLPTRRTWLRELFRCGGELRRGLRARAGSERSPVWHTLSPLPLPLPAQASRVLFSPPCLSRSVSLRHILRTHAFPPSVSDLSYRSWRNLSQTPTVAYSLYSESALLPESEADDRLSLFRTLTLPRHLRPQYAGLFIRGR